MKSKQDLCQILKLEEKKIEEGLLELGYDPFEEPYEDGCLEDLSMLFGILLDSQKSLSPAVESGAITLKEAGIIAQSRLNSAGVPISSEMVEYLFTTTQEQAIALGNAVADIFESNLEETIASRTENLITTTQLQITESTAAIKSATNYQPNQPKTKARIDFSKLKQENKEMFSS